MVSSALRRHKERQKEIERDEKKRRELKEGVFISDGTEAVADEKVTITETEAEHLARKKQEILDRNARRSAPYISRRRLGALPSTHRLISTQAKLSEIERRVRSSGNFGAHTAKEKGYSHKERHTMEYWASSDPELMARQEELERLEQAVEENEAEIEATQEAARQAALSLEEAREEGDHELVGAVYKKKQAEKEAKWAEAKRLAQEEAIRNGTYTPPIVHEVTSKEQARAMLEAAKERLEKIADTPKRSSKKKKKKKSSSKVYIDEEEVAAKALDAVAATATALAEAEALPDSDPTKALKLATAQRTYDAALVKADMREDEEGVVFSADGRPLPKKSQPRRSFAKRDRGRSFFANAKALEDAIDFEDGVRYKAPAAAPAPASGGVAEALASRFDTAADGDSIAAVVERRIDGVLAAAPSSKAPSGSEAPPSYKTSSGDEALLGEAPSGEAPAPVAAEAPAPAPARKRRHKKKKEQSIAEALLAEVEAERAASPEGQAVAAREREAARRAAEQEALAQAAAEKQAGLQANSDAAKELYRKRQAARRAKQAAASAEVPAPAPAPAPETALALVPRRPRRGQGDMLDFTEAPPAVVPLGASSVWEAHACELHGCCVDAAGKRAATAGEDTRAVVWDVRSGKRRHALAEHTEAVAAVAISDDGASIATGGRDNLVILWVAADGARLLTFEGHQSWVSSLHFSPGAGRYLASGSFDETARVWCCTTGNALGMFRDPDVSQLRGKPFVYDVAFDFKASRLLVGGRDGVGRIWDCASSEILVALEAHASSVLSVAWSPDGKRIATASKDRTCRVWSSKTGRVFAVLEGHAGQVTCVRFYPADGRKLADGKLAPPVSLATASRDATIRFWRVAPESRDPRVSPEEEAAWNATCGAVLRGHADRISAIAFDATGESLVSCGFDRVAVAWDVRRCCKLGTGPPPEVVLDDATVDAPTVLGFRG